MGEDQNPGLARVGVREGRPQAVAEAGRSGDGQDARAELGEVLAGEPDHRARGRRLEGRALALDPGPQTVEHRPGIEGQGGEVDVEGAHRDLAGVQGRIL